MASECLMIIQLTVRNGNISRLMELWLNKFMTNNKVSTSIIMLKWNSLRKLWGRKSLGIFPQRGSFISILIPLIANPPRRWGEQVVVWLWHLRRTRQMSRARVIRKERKARPPPKGAWTCRVSEIYYPRLSLNFFGLTVDFGCIYWQWEVGGCYF